MWDLPLPDIGTARADSRASAKAAARRRRRRNKITKRMTKMRKSRDPTTAPTIAPMGTPPLLDAPEASNPPFPSGYRVIWAGAPEIDVVTTWKAVTVWPVSGSTDKDWLTTPEEEFEWEVVDVVRVLVDKREFVTVRPVPVKVSVAV